MTSLRRRVEEYDVHTWASEFLQHLCACGCRTIPRVHRTVAPLSNVLQTTVQNGPVRLLLDYDGTLLDPDWTAKILAILERFTARTPGSRIERKSAAVTWHFRGAQRDYGARRAHELRMLLGDALSNQPLEVLEGKKVIEIRFRGISKAVVAHEAPAERGRRITVAFGDDRTDEDLFRALPESRITVAVGRDLAGARYRVNDHREVRQLLRSFIESSKVA